MTDKIEVPRRLLEGLLKNEEICLTLPYAREIDALLRAPAKEAESCKRHEVPTWLDGFEQEARKHADDPFHHDALRLAALLREAAQPECCGNPAQCWEPCGDLGKSAEHAKPIDDEELRMGALQNLRKELSLAVTYARELFHAEGSTYHEGRRVAYEQCLQWLDATIAAEKREGE